MYANPDTSFNNNSSRLLRLYSCAKTLPHLAEQQQQRGLGCKDAPQYGGLVAALQQWRRCAMGPIGTLKS
jgi:hypothetical protein